MDGKGLAAEVLFGSVDEWVVDEFGGANRFEQDLRSTPIK
jgi:hypothetical protein